MASAAEQRLPVAAAAVLHNGRVNGQAKLAGSSSSRHELFGTEPFPEFNDLSPLLPPNGDAAAPEAAAAAALPAASAAAGRESPQTSPRGASPVASPPYWHHSHQRTASSVSTESELPAGAITLQDNEVDDGPGGNGGAGGLGIRGLGTTSYGAERNRACWARSVQVTDHVVVNGSATNIGAFVVWNIKVETLSGSYMNIRKRYSEFDHFRQHLVQTFPDFEAAVPGLPPKGVISKFRPRFLEKRRAGLQYFLNCILLNPEFSGSPVLKDFLFA